MLSWIISNLASIIISMILILVIVIIVIRMVKNKREGKTSCGCGCGSCPMSESCHKADNKNKKKENS